MTKPRVGVLRGGLGHEYEVSLETGKSVLKHLPEKYSGHDILVTKDGSWHWQGLPMSPTHLAKRVDVVFNALHGEWGEDGKVQSLLDSLGVPYTGSKTASSALAMNKAAARDLVQREGLSVAPAMVVEADPDGNAALAARVFRRIAPSWIIKPVASGSSVGVVVAKVFPDLADALARAFQHSKQLLVEKYIPGREATCGVIDNFRGEDVYALPPIEIRRPVEKDFWDYSDKYSGATQEICPGRFTEAESRAIRAAAVAAHKAVGARHYSRSDFIVTPKGLYFLEINTLPGLTSESLLPKALAAVGCSYASFLEHTIDQALTGR